MDGDDDETPQNFEINDDIEIIAQDPPPIELEPATEAAIETKPVVTPSSIESPALQRFTKVGSNTNQDYYPRMTMKRYGYASTQL